MSQEDTPKLWPKLCRRLKSNRPESPQGVSTQKVVEANVLVSGHVDHLENKRVFELICLKNTVKIMSSLRYRLIGDNQLDDRQRVEHSDGGDVPGGGGEFTQTHHIRSGTQLHSRTTSSLSDTLLLHITAQNWE